MRVSPKKQLGQHFLINEKIAKKIVNSLALNKTSQIIEIGAGTGALTKFLIKKNTSLKLIEIDNDAIVVLKNKFENTIIIHADFLKLDLETIGFDNYAIIGNFPYNISNQILFKILENRNSIVEMVGMFQKEVAARICSKPKSKKYGILSVLMQAYFNCEILFDVNSNNFNPPPKVNSSVIRLTRNNVKELSCNHKKFIQVVKAGFGQRRKKLKNALKKFTNLDDSNLNETLSKRAEELSVFEFIVLTNKIFSNS